mmetsp:Transcript_95342/g.179257  ORF Transcript_95342/g.179257 Transcript_95342/m.179257 type:complete len:95 (-) Transcript_95342:311-595(-)
MDVRPVGWHSDDDVGHLALAPRLCDVPELSQEHSGDLHSGEDLLRSLVAYAEASLAIFRLSKWTRGPKLLVFHGRRLKLVPKQMLEIPARVLRI